MNGTPARASDASAIQQWPTKSFGAAQPCRPVRASMQACLYGNSRRYLRPLRTMLFQRTKLRRLGRLNPSPQHCYLGKPKLKALGQYSKISPDANLNALRTTAGATCRRKWAAHPSLAHHGSLKRVREIMGNCAAHRSLASGARAYP